MDIKPEAKRAIMKQLEMKYYHQLVTVYPQEEDLQALLEETLHMTWLTIDELIEVTTDIINPYKKRRRETKRRWIKKRIKDRGEEQHIDVMQIKDETLATSHLDVFEEKKHEQQEKALINDLIFDVYMTCYQMSHAPDRPLVLAIPHVITNLPQDYQNKVKLKDLTHHQGNYYQKIYEIDNEHVFETRVSVEALQHGLLMDSFSLLNTIDTAVLMYLISIAGPSLYQPIPFVVEIGEIVKHLDIFKAKNAREYQVVKESLIKMDYMEMRILDKKTLRNTKVEIFYKATIEVDTLTKREVARVVFSEDLINEWIKNHTIELYRDTLDSLESKSSRALIYGLERQRMIAETKNTTGCRLYLTEFRSMLIFGTTQRYRQIKYIEEGLDELKEKSITVKDYHRIGDMFSIEFFDKPSEPSSIPLLTLEQTKKHPLM